MLTIDAIRDLRIEERLKNEEGFSGVPYKDNADPPGWTIFYGHHLILPLSKAAGEVTLKEDMTIVRNAIWSIFGEIANNFPDSVYEAVFDMLFNLGQTRFNTFKKMIAALKDGNYSEAAKECRDSKYYKQLPGRAQRNVNLFAAGAVPPAPGTPRIAA